MKMNHLQAPKKQSQNKPNQTQFLWIPAGVYPAQSLPRTEFTPHFDAGMRGCGDAGQE